MAALTTPTVGSMIPSTAAVLGQGYAGGAITEGHPVYIDTAASNVIKEANANSSGSVIAATVAGIALHTCASGQLVTYVKSDSALTHGLTAGEIAPGDVVLLNDTAGAYTITPSDLDATDWVFVIGQINNPETTMRLSPAILNATAPVLKA